MRKYKYFNKIEIAILKVLYNQKLPLTIYELAKDSLISYPTAKAYAAKLLKRDLIKKIPTKKGVDKYQFNFKILTTWTTPSKRGHVSNILESAC